MKQIVKKGATSNLFCIFIQDSSSTTGAGLTGLTSGSSGLVCYRARSDDGNAGGTAISLSAGTKGTWSSGGFVEKDASNMPGVYELGVPDAVFATGSNYGIVMLKGATNMAPVVMEFELTSFDLMTATQKVDVDTIKTNPVVNGGTVTFPTTATLASTTNITAGTITTATNLTTNNDKTGYGLSSAAVTAIWQDTTASDFTTALSIGKSIMNGVSLGTGLTIAAVSGAVGSVTGAVGSVTGAVGSVTGAVGSVTAGVTLASPPGIRKNVALAAFEILMTDSTNHNPLTGATVAVTRSVDGAAFGAGTIANITEIANGFYKFDFGSGDLNGTNIAVRCTATGADDLAFTIHTDP